MGYGIRRRSEVPNHRVELLLDRRDDVIDERVERAVFLQLHRRGHQRDDAVEAPVGVPAAFLDLGGGMPQRRGFHVAAADVLDAGHRPLVRAHVELDVRGGERGRSPARQRIDLLVMVAVQNAVRVRRRRLIRRSTGEQRAPAIVCQSFQGLAQPLVVEHLGTRAEIRHPVDFGGMADETVDGPAQRTVVCGIRRHAVGRNQPVLTPWHQPDLVADDGLDVAGDDLRDQVGLEERVGNPRSRLVCLVNERETARRDVRPWTAGRRRSSGRPDCECPNRSCRRAWRGCVATAPRMSTTGWRSTGPPRALRLRTA